MFFQGCFALRSVHVNRNWLCSFGRSGVIGGALDIFFSFQFFLFTSPLPHFALPCHNFLVMVKWHVTEGPPHSLSLSLFEAFEAKYKM